MGFTEISLAHCPVDHGKLQRRAQNKEYWQKAIDAKASLTGPIVEQTSHGSAIKTHPAFGLYKWPVQWG